MVCFQLMFNLQVCLLILYDCLLFMGLILEDLWNRQKIVGLGVVFKFFMKVIMFYVKNFCDEVKSL